MPNLSFFDLSGKKALVTGGSSGIGRACATALAMGGADVAIVARNEEVGKKTVELIKAMGVDSFFVLCDITSEQQIQTMIAAVVERFGRLDIAINNAGINGSAEKDELQSKKTWDKVMAVNLSGVWLCAQAQAQQMIKQTPCEGKIINVASISGTTSLVSSSGPYGASKAGVIHLTRTLALQWGPFNININCFSPGVVMTPMTSALPTEFHQRIRETTPMGRIQRPEDVYGPILFLASGASNFVTGQNMIVDGGHTLSTWVEPIKREVLPRVSLEEAVELKKDLDAIDISYNENRLSSDNE